MGRNKCFVPGCSTGYGSDRKKKKSCNQKVGSLFYPKNDQRLAKWKKAIPGADKEYSSKDAVCELHFDEQVIERFYELKLSDGTMFKMEKGRISLKDNAIPVKFPNLPSYLSKVVNKRKAPTLQIPVAVQKSKRRKVECIKIDLLVDEPILDTVYTFNLLVESIEQIKKPNAW